MSVLNQSGEEQVECPLCMEPLEVDDLNFYPCTCGYQICRFCWHRIRTDENGLCPACRKAYSENPADFTPLSKEQVAQLKAEKRQRDQQRKAKLSESRKHLASVRVVQKNLVFVVGLPVRLADADVLKRHEYFGKFGKIHKVVINQSTSYAGSQGPSASAYVTYVKSEDALRAIQNVNNIMLDGRLIKSSLGTTKYCSHFMKNQPCPKADCMYLHDFGDSEASFTKEQMHMGKHQEYEKKLHEALLSRTAQQQQQQQQHGSSSQSQQQQQPAEKQQTSQRERPGAAERDAATTNTNGNHQQGSSSSSSSSTASSCASGLDGGRSTTKSGAGNSVQSNAKDTNNWPTLSNNSTATETATTTTASTTFSNNKSEKQKSESKSERVQKRNNQKNKNNNNSSTTNNNNIESTKKSEKASKNHCEQNNCQSQQSQQQKSEQTPATQTTQSQPQSEQSQRHPQQQSQANADKQQKASTTPTTTKESTEVPSTTTSNNQTNECIESLSKMHIIDDNSSFFSHNSFQKIVPEHDSSSYSTDSSSVTPHSNILNDSLPDINSSEDWQAAFGFTNTKRDSPQIEILNSANRSMTENGLANYTQQNFENNRQQNCYNKFDIDLTNNSVPFKLLDLQNERALSSTTPYINLNQKLPDNGLNGLDQQMSKFFAEFHKQNQQKDVFNGFNNGFVQSLNERQNFIGNQMGLNDSQHMLLLNQYHQRFLDKHLEEQALYNLKHNMYQQHQQQQQQQQFLPNHATTLHHSDTQQFLTNGGDHFLTHNGQSFGNGAYTQNSVFQNQSLQRGQAPMRDRSAADDDLGFDPFHETQKALAELIESEQGVPQLQNTGLLNQAGGMSSHGSSGGSGAAVNGLLHGSVTSTAPSCLPPPPGFMQHNTHMNSFGSKILPFLNMSSSQQISTSGGWSNNYSEAHLKGLASVNDWMTLDPAIVSSSRHFPLASLQPLRDQYAPFQQQQQQQQNGPIRASYDFTQTNGYTNNYSQQQQHNIQTYTNNFNTLHNGLNWYANSDIHNQISSPPGFRATASNTKTQEC